MAFHSKYYNGLRNTLGGVASHADNYPGFTDGHGRYHIPGDQYRQLEELRRTGGIFEAWAQRAYTFRDLARALHLADFPWPERIAEINQWADPNYLEQ